jgi:hypothetical protein
MYASTSRKPIPSHSPGVSHHSAAHASVPVPANAIPSGPSIHKLCEYPRLQDRQRGDQRRLVGPLSSPCRSATAAIDEEMGGAELFAARPWVFVCSTWWAVDWLIPWGREKTMMSEKDDWTVTLYFYLMLGI